MEHLQIIHFDTQWVSESHRQVEVIFEVSIDGGFAAATRDEPESEPTIEITSCRLVNPKQDAFAQGYVDLLNEQADFDHVAEEILNELHKNWIRGKAA